MNKSIHLIGQYFRENTRFSHLPRFAGAQVAITLHHQINTRINICLAFIMFLFYVLRLKKKNGDHIISRRHRLNTQLAKVKSVYNTHCTK